MKVKIGFSLVCVVLLLGVYGWFVNLPMVKLDPRTNKSVACAWAENGWKETPISDARCQKILKGRFETVY